MLAQGHPFPRAASVRWLICLGHKCQFPPLNVGQLSSRAPSPWLRLYRSSPSPSARSCSVPALPSTRLTSRGHPDPHPAGQSPPQRWLSGNPTAGGFRGGKDSRSLLGGPTSWNEGPETSELLREVSGQPLPGSAGAALGQSGARQGRQGST